MTPEYAGVEGRLKKLEVIPVVDASGQFVYYRVVITMTAPVPAPQKDSDGKP